jgi:transmembrane 9 superfamily protein 1
VLDGDRMALSLYNISFKTSFERRTLCTNELDEQDILRLKHAIEDLYYFEFVYGELTQHLCVE